MNSYFLDASGKQISSNEVIDEIKNFISAVPEANYKIIIGSDSQLYGEGVADFVTAIVVHRIGNGGRYFWRKFEKENTYSLRDRIIKEVMLSLNTSTEILKILEEKIEVKFDFEVHVDVGENGKTSALISEVTGMIRAYNFNFKTKPESYAASSVADKHV
jgi:predicted RNase H-related nuclease YkuK (DUF458 family)